MLVSCVINACNKIRGWGIAVSDVANILSVYYYTIIARLKHHFIACICTYICICTFCIWKPFRSVFPVLQLMLILRRIKLKCRISRLNWELTSAFPFRRGRSHRKVDLHSNMVHQRFGTFWNWVQSKHFLLFRFVQFCKYGNYISI